MRYRSRLYTRAIACLTALVLLSTHATLAQEALDAGRAGPTGSAAPVLKPILDEAGLKRVEVSAPGEFLESNCLYVLTKDIVAPRTALSFGKAWNVRITNCIIDLNGHTITYNTEDYNRTFRETCFGIKTFGGGPIIIRNGAIIQGPGKNAGCHGIDLHGTRAEIHGVTVKVTGAGCINITRAGGGKGGRIHDTFLVNDATSIARGFTCPVGIMSIYTGSDWEYDNNTIIGGHRCIAVHANARQSHITRAKIHHNRLAPRRTHGVKAPHGILIYTAEQNEVYENLIDAIDARGINVQMSSKDNRVHHNLVAARYVSDARGGGGYVENRCYGYWERSGGKAGNSACNNVFIVNNATTGDATSETRGIFVGTGDAYPEPLQTGEYRNNVVVCRHKDPKAQVSGMVFKRCGKGVLVEGNRIFSTGVGINIWTGPEGIRVARNTVFRPAGAPMAQPVMGDVANATVEGNMLLTLPVDGDAPAAPAGLEAIKRIGAVELRWRLNAEADVLGYYVYKDDKRVEGPMRHAPFHVDFSATPGRRHAYTVTAVDVSGNEGPKCTAVRVVP